MQYEYEAYGGKIQSQEINTRFLVAGGLQFAVEHGMWPITQLRRGKVDFLQGITDIIFEQTFKNSFVQRGLKGDVCAL